MDLTGALPPMDRDLEGRMSASPPGGAAEAAWSHGYHLVAGGEAGGGQQRLTADWSLDPDGGAVAGGRSGGSPSGHRSQPSYPPEMSGWSQQTDTLKSGPPTSGRRILCRSQSEAGSSLGGRMAADSPSLADMAANYQPAKATTTALYSSAALQNGHGYDSQSLAASPSGMERASGGGHLYHARSDVQQSEAAALRTPPPPLLHSTSLGDMKDRAVDIMAAKNASGRFLRPQDWNGPAAVRPPNQGGTRYFEPAAQSGHGESLLKRGRGEEGGGGGGSGGASPPDRLDACSHCGSHHGAGGCPLTNRGFAEKVSGGFLFI
jgi:hypothetical protein